MQICCSSDISFYSFSFSPEFLLYGWRHSTSIPSFSFSFFLSPFFFPFFLFLSLSFFFFYFYGCTHGTWKFLGQELNPRHSCDLRHSCSNDRSFNPLFQGQILNLHLHTNLSYCSWILNPLCHGRNYQSLFLNLHFFISSFFNETLSECFSI